MQLSVNAKNVLWIVFLSIGIKFFYALCAIFFTNYFPDLYTSCDFNGLIYIFRRNDTWWYQKIVENWYPIVHSKAELGQCCNNMPKVQSVWAFFPLYPGIVRCLMIFLNITIDQAFFIVSLLTSTLSFIGFYRFTAAFLNDSKQAFFITFVFCLFPFHFFFSMFYTEALFFCLTIWAFIFIRENKMYLLFIPLLLLPLTRPNGLFIMLPIFVYYLEQKSLLLNFRLKLNNISKTTIIHASFFVLPLISFGLYCYYQYLMTGYWNAFAIAQDGWCKKISFPLFHLFDGTKPSQIFNSLYAFAIIVFAGFTWKKHPLSLNLFIWINILLPMLTSVVSMPRYISIIFPVWIIIGMYFYSCNKVLKYTIFILFIPVHILLFYLWMKSSYFCI